MGLDFVEGKKLWVVAYFKIWLGVGGYKMVWLGLYVKIGPHVVGYVWMWIHMDGCICPNMVSGGWVHKFKYGIVLAVLGGCR